MKMRTLWFAAAASFLLAAISTHAQGRWEVTPFAGYETGGSFPVNSSSSVTTPNPIYDQLQLNGSVAYGAFVDYNLTENFQPEFMWTRNSTSYSAHNILTNNYDFAYNSAVNQFQFGALYMLRSSEVRLRPFVVASVGFTHEFNDNGNPDRTAFGWSIGGGVKYELSRHFGLRGDLRYMPTYGSSSPQCDYYYGCYNSGNYLNRFGAIGGIVIKF